MTHRFPLALCLLLILCPIVTYGQTWNLLNDFSATENPNGAWTFGWRPTATAPLIPYTDIQHDTGCSPDPNVYIWNYQLYSTALSVDKNFNDHEWSCNGCDYPPNTVWFHPGPTQQSVVRWTAPGGMPIAVAAHFLALDTGSSIVRVYYNGSELFSETLPDIGATADYAFATICNAGDIVDIAIDAISHTDDSVKLDVVIGPPVGACCFASGACLEGTAADCEAAGGSYMGDGSSCDSDPCGPTPVENSTWSRMKTLFRQGD
jgi:hypothetical protein